MPIFLKHFDHKSMLNFVKGFSASIEMIMFFTSSTLAWKIPWTEKPGRLQSMGRKESDTTEQLHYRELWASLVVQIVKNPPAMQETQVLYLDQENPLEKGMATHSRMLASKIS